MDLAYISAELAVATPEGARFVEGVPVLAVEILSPCNTWERITQKIRDYLDAGVPLTWVIDPVFRTVQVYRPGCEPVMLNSLEDLSGDPHLPGFRVPVAALFEG